MDKQLEDICSQILCELKKADYCISEDRILQMKTLVRNVSVYVVNKPGYITLYDFMSQPVGKIRIRNRSQTLDPLPVWNEGRRIDIAPAMVLREDADHWAKVHEICHLLSIGPYAAKTDNVYHHYFGSLTYQYKLEASCLMRLNASGHVGINEIINDYVVWHFIKNFGFGDYQPNRRLKYFSQYVNAGAHNAPFEFAFIGSYFSGAAQVIESLLLQNKFESYDALYQFLDCVK